MTDVLLYQTADDGDIISQNGVVQLTNQFDTAVYISLFGGNFADDGIPDSNQQWWGNSLDADTSRHVRGETETLLSGLPVVSRNLRKVEAAALRDLNWMLMSKVADNITAVASIPTINKIKLVITITAQGEESQFEYVENWKAGS